MDIREVKQELIKYGKRAGKKNFTPGISGNMSARVGENILITTSGSANGYLKEGDFALINFDGSLVEGTHHPESPSAAHLTKDAKKPSSEKMLHVEFYKMRPDVNYIIHVHSPCLSAFASCRTALDEAIMAENVFYFGQIPLADYALPSTEDLVRKTAKYFKDYTAVLMANHGFIVGDKTIRDAYLKLELAESYAQVVLNTKILGGASLLNQQEIDEINRLRGNV
ncbi:MAG: class II aldolase/adducin family protein [Heliobacteriaceae bacterium]|jgi:L-fuculose-phosphate aldolase|nr:class II aldolase/adducin family protein [Heliobacteriaceae bacterium]